jgi:vitamin B12 transporter
MRRWIKMVACAAVVSPRAAAAQQDPFELVGLIVTASPTPRPASAVARSVTVLEGEALRARGVLRVADALRDVPGVTVVQGGSFGATTSVFMRGGESDYVQVLVDGVQVNQPGGSFDFAALTLDDVARIEVLRGPASSLFGSDAVAGVIHIITGTGRGPAALSLSVQGGSYGRREASLAASGGSAGTSWSLAASRLRTDGVFPFNNRHENTVLSGSVRLAPDARTRASVAVRLSDRTYGFPTDATGAAVDHNALTFGDEASVALSGARWLGDHLELRTLVTLARMEGGTDDASDDAADTLGYYGFSSLDHVQRSAVDVRGNLYLGGAVATAGFEGEREKQRSFSESASEWGVTSGRSAYTRGNRAAFLHLTGAAGSWAWALGGRLEDNEQYGHFPTWNGGLTWRPVEGTRLRGSAGSAIKEPTFYESYAEGYVRGNPALDPERARSWEVGVEQEALGQRATLRATFFQERFRDLIQYTAVPPAPGAPNYFNLAGADVRGVEVSAALRAGVASIDASWTWLDGRVSEGGADEGAGGEFVPGDRLLRRPASTLRLHGALHAERGDASVTLRVVGDRADRDFTTFPATRVTLPRHATVDAGAEVPIHRGAGGPSWVLRLRAENLLDARYEEIVGFPAPGRALYVGARIVLGGQ